MMPLSFLVVPITIVAALTLPTAQASPFHTRGADPATISIPVDPDLGLYTERAAPPPPPTGTWEKFLLTDAVASGAVCLDGSPGGGYIRKGDPKKWIIFHQGGGWCSSDVNCAERAGTALGSSKSWGPTYTDSYEGSQLFVTPPFDKYTVVYAMYCDGGSWSANAEKPVSVQVHPNQPNQTIYYRGRRLLDAMINHLLEEQGLKDATNLLYSGCSAGGLTTYLHTDYVAGLMPPTIKTLALADAMFAVEHNSFNRGPLYPDRMSWGYTAWNSSASVNQACLASYGAENGYKCMFGANAAAFVKTPLFVLNSKYDTWQEKAIIGVNCTIKECPPDEQKFWSAYSDIMVSKAQALPPQHGVFLGNCPNHCQTGIPSWESVTIDGVAMGEAVTTWYNDRVNGGSTAVRHIATCDVSPCGTDTC
eukprot:m.29423 g.29423  ORF g.29423 m.29423 type:complete len:420 (-) comp4592_c0_seq2:309-1568(-)